MLQRFKDQCPQYIEYLEQQGIDSNNYFKWLEEYQKDGLRYLRVRNQNILADIISKGFNKTDFKDLVWIKRQSKVAHFEEYKSKQVIGIDFGSYILSQIIELKEGDCFLDLCCAPGSKLSCIVDKYHQQIVNQSITIYGNDITQQRLKVAESILTQLQIKDLVHLVNKDGRELSIKDFQIRPSVILVDVECSHDGSFKHILKYFENQNESMPWKMSKITSSILETHKQEELALLQYNLLLNAIKLVQDKGVVYYSTCSLSVKQNEEIIQRILQKNICIAEEINLSMDTMNKYNIIRDFQTKGVRFIPNQINCGGFFICKLIKF